MFILLSGKMPFPGQTEEEILRNVAKGNFDLKQKEFLKISLEAKDLICKLLTFNPRQRPNARAALRHPWFKVNSEKISLKEIQNVKEALANLLKFRAERKFQQAVITFITHNLIKSEEVNNLRKIFECIDRDSDARINKADIKHAFWEVFEQKLEANQIEKLMKNIDHDNSGFIEYEEFIRATISKEIVLNEDNLRMGFNLFDIDNNGFISADEINKTIGGGKSIPDNLIVELLAEIGKSYGQEICFEEYKKIMKKIFVNDNGVSDININNSLFYNEEIIKADDGKSK
jgi:calcium-dependent protein kinase